MKVIAKTVSLFKYSELDKKAQLKAKCEFVAGSHYFEDLGAEHRALVNKPFVHNALCVSAQWYDEEGYAHSGKLIG